MSEEDSRINDKETSIRIEQNHLKTEILKEFTQEFSTKERPETLHNIKSKKLEVRNKIREIEKCIKSFYYWFCIRNDRNISSPVNIKKGNELFYFANENKIKELGALEKLCYAVKHEIPIKITVQGKDGSIYKVNSSNISQPIIEPLIKLVEELKFVKDRSVDDYCRHRINIDGNIIDGFKINFKFEAKIGAKNDVFIHLFIEELKSLLKGNGVSNKFRENYTQLAKCLDLVFEEVEKEKEQEIQDSKKDFFLGSKEYSYIEASTIKTKDLIEQIQSLYQSSHSLLNNVIGGEILKKFISECSNSISQIPKLNAQIKGLMDLRYLNKKEESFSLENGNSNDDEGLKAMEELCSQLLKLEKEALIEYTTSKKSNEVEEKRGENFPRFFSEMLPASICESPQAIFLARENKSNGR